MALPATPSSVVTARLTASGVSLRKIITRCAAGVVPMQRIFIERISNKSSPAIRLCVNKGFTFRNGNNLNEVVAVGAR